MNDNYTLYSDIERKWYFLVPDEVTLMPGDFDIYTLTGTKQSVNPKALEQFEVSREVAEEWVKDRVRGVINQAADGLKGFLNTWYWKGHPDAPKEQKPKFTFDVIADLMGERPDDLKLDPEARKRGWEMLFSHAAMVFGAAVSGDPEELTLAKIRMREIVEVLNEHGIPVSTTVKELPQKLYDLYRAAEKK